VRYPFYLLGVAVLVVVGSPGLLKIIHKGGPKSAPAPAPAIPVAADTQTPAPQQPREPGRTAGFDVCRDPLGALWATPEPARETDRNMVSDRQQVVDNGHGDAGGGP
jgi:hypothetical protein